MDVQKGLRRVDAVQQRRVWLAFPFAVVKKFGDDQAGNLAALIAYYGFFSLFPLLLAFVAILGLVLQGNPDLQQKIVDSALAQFPVIGPDIQKNIGSLPSSGLALAVGLFGAVWAGLGVTQSAQYAMNQIWDVPMKHRPNFIQKRVRGLILLAVLGVVTLASAFLSALGAAGGSLSGALRLAGFAGSLALNLALFLLMFRVLTDRPLRWADVFPGAAVAAVLWLGLQALGGWYVTRQVTNAQNVYGTFALVIGLLVWIYLGAQMTLLCAEINVVRARRLWPRSLVQPPLQEADERTFRDAAKVEERIAQQHVEVRFDEGTVMSAGEVPSGSPVPRPPLASGGPRPPSERRSTFELVRSILADLGELVRKEIELARREVAEGARAPLVAVATLVFAAGLALLAVSFLAQAATTALDGVLPTWAARVIVAGAFLIVVAGAVAFAVRHSRRPPLAPLEAKRTTQESLRWAKEGFRSPEPAAHPSADPAEGSR